MSNKLSAACRQSSCPTVISSPHVADRRLDRADATACLNLLSTSDDPSNSSIDVVAEAPAERGLRRYVRRIAARMGLGSTDVWCELADEANAYVALKQRLASRPGREVVLVWDDGRGWAVGVETYSGEDLLMVAWYGPELLPTPEEVARFTQNVLSGRVDQSMPPEVSPAARSRVRVQLAHRFAFD